MVVNTLILLANKDVPTKERGDIIPRKVSLICHYASKNRMTAWLCT